MPIKRKKPQTLTLDEDRKLETQLKVKVLELDKMLPENVLAFAHQVPPEYLNIDQDLLEHKIRANYSWSPPNTVERIRNNFWMEYERCIDSGELFNVDHLWQGACPRGLLYEYLGSWKNMAWILCKPAAYLQQLESMYSLALKRINELIMHPFIKDNKIDHRHADLVLKAANMLDMRLKGGYVQKQLTITKEHKTVEFSRNPDERMNDLDAKLNQLEEEAKRLTLQPEPVDTIAHLTNITETKKPEPVNQPVIETTAEEIL